MISFGFYSFALLIGAIQGVVIAVGLMFSLANRQANRILAALILFLTLKLVPYIIGFAGFYAVYPWLDLAPFNFALGIGPALYGYIFTVTTHRVPPRWWLHLLPVGLQALAYASLFVQPMQFKNHFEATIGPAFNRIETLVTVVSISGYLLLSWKHFNGSAREFGRLPGGEDAARTLRRFLAPVSIAVGVFAGAKTVDSFVKDMSYTQMFPVYVLINLVIYILGFSIFRQAAVSVPMVVQPTPIESPDFGPLAQQLTDRMEKLELWRNPETSLSSAAASLGMNEAKLSKALNKGAGMGFGEWINRCRVEKAAALLKAGDKRTILELAFECGFNSKASFNRWFRAVKGMSPSEFRSDSPRT